MKPSIRNLARHGLLVAAALAGSVVAAAPPDAALLLRRGVWDGGVGSYDVPAPLATLAPERWPVDGWYRLRLLGDRLEGEAVVAAAGHAPEFLESIVGQVASGAALDLPRDPEPNEIYLRVPGVALQAGPIVPIVFRNGSSKLVPKLDFRYELELGGQRFALTVQNGRRTAAGTPYGSGAQYVVEIDGESYEYLIGEFGWSSRIEAIADLDGDGKPDFVISVDGNNSADEVVLLSSRARPGRNQATARLRNMGC